MPNHPLDEAARQMYGEPPAAPDPRDFFTYSAAGAVIDQRGPELWTKTGATSAEQQQLRNTFRDMERQTGLPDAVTAKIADLHISGLLSDARISEDPEGDAIAHDQRVVSGNGEIREQLVAQYGVKSGEELLARTQKFVRAHPALAKLVREHGIGARPDVVLPIAAHVFSTGWR